MFNLRSIHVHPLWGALQTRQTSRALMEPAYDCDTEDSLKIVRIFNLIL